MKDLAKLEAGKKYRLRWIGSVTESENIGEKLIHLHYQEISNYDLFFKEHKAGTAFKNKIFLGGEDVVTKSNITRLPGLTIGSIYQDEIKINHHDNYSARVSLKIDPSKGYEDSIHNLVGRYGLYDLPSDLQMNSKVWVFTDLQGIYPKQKKDNEATFDILLIPTYEIIRFYYCKTSNLASALFNGGLMTKEIVYLMKWDHDERKNGVNPFLVLGKRMKDICAETIGRMIFSEEGFRNAKNIYESLLMSAQGRFPSSGFPFEDTTELLMNYEGLGLKASSPFFKNFPEFPKNTRVKIATQILSCSHPFPFQHLDYLRENDARSIEDNANAKPRKGGVKPGKSGDGNEPPPPKPGEEIDGEGEERDQDTEPVIDANLLDVEPFANRPVCSKLEKTEQKTKRKVLSARKKTPGGKTRGKIPGDGGLEGVDSEQVDAPMDGVTGESFIELAKHLTDSGFKSKVFNLNGGSFDFSYFPSNELRSKPGHAWCFLIYDSHLRTWVKRKCWVVNFKHNNMKDFYLIEIQRRLANPNVLQPDASDKKSKEGFMLFVVRLKDATNTTESEKKSEDDILKSFLLKLAINRGNYSSVNKDDNLSVTGVKHMTADSVNDRSERIFSQLKRLSD